MAIIGAYIGKIHVETKKRPLYLAECIEAKGAGRPRGGSRNAKKNNKRG
jgi:hypothetical protein